MFFKNTDIYRQREGIFHSICTVFFVTKKFFELDTFPSGQILPATTLNIYPYNDNIFTFSVMWQFVIHLKNYN